MNHYLHELLLKLPHMRKFHTVISVTYSPSNLNISSYMLQLLFDSSNMIFVNHASILGIGLGLYLKDTFYKVDLFEDLNNNGKK